MRHRTEKYKEKTTRKNPNMERIVDVHNNLIDCAHIKEEQKKKAESNK